MQAWKVLLLGYLSGVWRRRWYMVAVAWAVCVLGWIGVALIPDRYSVDAKVYIDTDTLMEPLLKGMTVQVNSDQRVQIMLHSLLTRPNLEQIERLVDHHADAMSPAEMDLTLQKLERDIIVRPLGTKNLFEISYSNSDPDYAEAVTQALINLLLESNAGGKRRENEDAQSFLNGKIAEYEGLLRDAERRRAQFKEANIEQLGGEHPDSNRVETARGELDRANRDLETATIRRNNLRAQLATVPATLSMDMAPPIVVGGGLNGWESDRVSLMQRIREQQKTVDELKSRFTDAHPDVIAASKLLADLKAKQLAMPADSHGGPGGTRQQGVQNPVYEQLRVKLVDEEGNVTLAEHHLADAKANLEHQQQQLGRAAEIEAKYTDLDRDYGIIRKNYEELLERRESARLSAAVDNHGTNISLRLIEPAHRSERPVAPNRPLFNTAVLVLAIGAGIGLALILSIHAGAFITGSELSEAFGLPVIGVVTRLQRSDDRRRVSGIAVRFGIACASLCLCYFGVLVLLNTSLHLRHMLSI
ncbi:MAG TPA: XrtA system polysaccharide chain length determinant [Aliidongia sp.]|nr:XrtA system polysaccharide chain length determinant [Aliidongia sp.]